MPSTIITQGRSKGYVTIENALIDALFEIDIEVAGFYAALKRFIDRRDPKNAPGQVMDWSVEAFCKRFKMGKARFYRIMDILWQVGLVDVSKEPLEHGWRNQYVVHDYPPYEGPLRKIREGSFRQKRNNEEKLDGADETEPKDNNANLRSNAIRHEFRRSGFEDSLNEQQAIGPRMTETNIAEMELSVSSKTKQPVSSETELAGSSKPELPGSSEMELPGSSKTELPDSSKLELPDSSGLDLTKIQVPEKKQVLRKKALSSSDEEERDASRLEHNSTLLDPEHLRKERTVSEVQGPISTPSASNNYTASATEERSTYSKPSSDGRTCGSLVTESSNDRITPSSTVAVTEESRGAEKSDEQPDRQKQVGSLGSGTLPTPPTNQQLIAELVKKFWQIPGIKPERGHYPMVGKAYIQYGYDAVQAGIQDLTVEFTWRQARGMPIPEGKDLWAYFIKKCQWNYKRPLTPEEIEERKKPSYDTVMCKKLPDGRVVPKTMDELMQTLMPPGHAYKIVGSKIYVYPVKSPKPAGVADAPANKGGNTCA